MAAHLRPAAVCVGTGRLDVFARGGDNALWHKWWTGSALVRLGDPRWRAYVCARAACRGAAVVWTSSRAVTDNALWHKWWTGVPGPAGRASAAVLTTEPAPVSWGPGRSDVFARGGDNAFWHKWLTGSAWSGWELGGGITTDAGPGARGGRAIWMCLRAGRQRALAQMVAKG